MNFVQTKSRLESGFDLVQKNSRLWTKSGLIPMMDISAVHYLIMFKIPSPSFASKEDPWNSLHFISHLLFDNRKVYGKLIKKRFRIESDFLTALSVRWLIVRPQRIILTDIIVLLFHILLKKFEEFHTETNFIKEGWKYVQRSKIKFI